VDNVGNLFITESYRVRRVDAVTQSGGKTSLSTSALTAGTHSITGVYQGTAGFGDSTVAITQAVSRATTTTALAASPNRALVLQLVTLTAVVSGQLNGPATGSVVFSANGTVLGTEPLIGNQAILKIRFPSLGIRSITAQSAGDHNNVASTSATHRLPIVTATTTTVNSSPNPGFVGQMVTFTANVSSVKGLPPDGQTITFIRGTTLLGTAQLSGGNSFIQHYCIGSGHLDCQGELCWRRQLWRE
jgi:hypothetical protein